MTPANVDQLSSQLELPLVDVAEQQRKAIESLASLDMSGIVYFRPLPDEDLTTAGARLRPLIKQAERRNDIKLLVKDAGSMLRVRRIPVDGASGRLAEWRNLLPGKTDSLYEHLTEDVYWPLFRKVADTAARLRKSGFDVSVRHGDDSMQRYERILIERPIGSKNLVGQRRPVIY